MHNFSNRAMFTILYQYVTANAYSILYYSHVGRCMFGLRQSFMYAFIVCVSSTPVAEHNSYAVALRQFVAKFNTETNQTQDQLR
jgi:hypothetical protein